MRWVVIIAKSPGEREQRVAAKLSAQKKERVDVSCSVTALSSVSARSAFGSARWFRRHWRPAGARLLRSRGENGAHSGCHDDSAPLTGATRVHRDGVRGARTEACSGGGRAGRRCQHRGGRAAASGPGPTSSPPTPPASSRLAITVSICFAAPRHPCLHRSPAAAFLRASLGILGLGRILATRACMRGFDAGCVPGAYIMAVCSLYSSQ